MHAIITSSRDFTRVLQYHQRKERCGKGECIDAQNFVKAQEQLTAADVQYQFQRLASRNEKMQRKIAHIFLRFDQHENIDNPQMALVAQEYLEGMRFGDQPWLTYRHYDSLIPHAHLVSSFVREDGSKLKLHLRDLYHSRELTHSLEEKYHLHQSTYTTLSPDEAIDYWEKPQFGEKPLYTSINGVVENLIPSYAYTSLDELNALLSCYDLHASRGRESSASFRHGGLSYMPIRNGRPDTNLAMLASSFPGRPTLAHLEERFATNEIRREPHRQHLVTAVAWALAGPALSLDAFREAMGYEGINLISRTDESGALQNCWFIDHASRTVFEGAALGQDYSAESLSRRLISSEAYQQQQSETLAETRQHSLHW